jgi:hypothetical protein
VVLVVLVVLVMVVQVVTEAWLVLVVTITLTMAVLVVQQVHLAQHQVQQAQYYQATQDKLVKGNYYEYSSKKN